MTRKEEGATTASSFLLTFCVINGAGEYRLQKYLQHSSIQMSQHYVKLFAQDLKRGAEEFSPLDNAKKKQKRTSAFKKSNS